jgi:hypothetical protein
MVPAWYMKFVPGHHGALDRVGGLPTHLPPEWPTSSTGKPLRFEVQFHCDGVRLKLENTFLLQIYRDDPCENPQPVVVRVPFGTQPNSQQMGTPDPDAAPHDIEWDYREDPNEAGDDSLELVASKLWGTCYFAHALQAGERLLLFLDEKPVGFNFGGDELMLAIDQAGDIHWVGA